jgi:hypothetical protein
MDAIALYLASRKGEGMKAWGKCGGRPLSPTASMCQSGNCVDPLSGKEPQMKRTTIGLDIAKRVFQAHAVDPESGEVRRTKLQRSEVLRHFAQLRPSLVAVEACGSAQHWAASRLEVPWQEAAGLAVPVNRRAADTLAKQE